MSARRLISTALVSLCTVVGALAPGGVSAQAVVTHKYLSQQITEVPAGSGAALTGPLATEALTVDSGELYVADGYQSAANGRQDVFNDSSGAFVSQLPQVPGVGYPLGALGYSYQGIAVGHATGETEVYVGGDELKKGAKPSEDVIEGSVAVFSAAGVLQSVWKGADTPAGAFGGFNRNAQGAIAVDDSGNPLTKGDVYVLSPEQGVVDVFEAKAGGGETYVTQIPGPEPEANPTVHFLAPYGGSSVAVDPLSGDVLVVNGSEVDELERTALNVYVPVRQITGSPAGSFGGAVGVAVDGGNGEIYVWEEERGEAVYQFSPTGSYLGRLSVPSGRVVRSVAVDPVSHHVYVGTYPTVYQPGGVEFYGADEVVPQVTSEAASGVRARSATLNGMVDPEEAGAATCRFEWGTSLSFGHVAPCTEGVPNGPSAVAVHAEVSGLAPDTVYYYRLTASNANGTDFGEAFQDQGEFDDVGAGCRGRSLGDGGGLDVGDV